MGRWERTWPVAITAIGVGALIGTAVLGPPTLSLLREEAPPEPSVLQRREVLLPPLPVRPMPPRAPREARPAAPVVDGLLVRDRRGNDLVIGTDELLEMLRTDEQATTRRLAAAALATSQRPEHVSPALMIAASADADPTVRATAARSLGRLGAEEVVAVLLVAALTDEDPSARGAAVAAIGELPQPVARDVLMRVVSILSNDRSEQVRVQAALALGHIGGEAARAAIERARDGDPSDNVRRAAIVALARIQLRDGR